MNEPVDWSRFQPVDDSRSHLRPLEPSAEVDWSRFTPIEEEPDRQPVDWSRFTPITEVSDGQPLPEGFVLESQDGGPLDGLPPTPQGFATEDHGTPEQAPINGAAYRGGILGRMVEGATGIAPGHILPESAKAFAQDLGGVIGSGLKSSATLPAAVGRSRQIEVARALESVSEDPDTARDLVRMSEMLGGEDRAGLLRAAERIRAGEPVEQVREGLQSLPIMTTSSNPEETGRYQAGERIIREAQERFPRGEGYEDKFLLDAVGTTASLLSFAALSYVAGPAGSFGFAGMLGAQEAYDRARSSGLEPGEALDYALQGIGPGAIQALPAELILRKLPRGKQRDAMTFLRRVGEAFGGEFAVENAGAILQNMVEAQYNPDQPWHEGVPMQGVTSGTGAAAIQALFLSLARRGPKVDINTRDAWQEARDQAATEMEERRGQEDPIDRIERGERHSLTSEERAERLRQNRMMTELSQLEGLDDPASQARAQELREALADTGPVLDLVGDDRATPASPDVQAAPPDDTGNAIENLVLPRPGGMQDGDIRIDPDTQVAAQGAAPGGTDVPGGRDPAPAQPDVPSMARVQTSPGGNISTGAEAVPGGDGGRDALSAETQATLPETTDDRSAAEPQRLAEEMIDQASRPSPIVKKDGTPYHTWKAAELASRVRPDLKGKGYVPVQVEGGWGLMPPDSAAAPAVPPAPRADGPVLRRDGKPFATRKLAELAARGREDLKGRGLVPVEVEGGYGLAQPSGEAGTAKSAQVSSSLAAAAERTESGNQPRHPTDVRIVSITGTEIDSQARESLQAKARRWMRDNLQGKSFTNAHTGWQISVGRKGLNKTLNHAAKESHARSVAAIPDLLRGAVLVATEANRNASEAADIPYVHHFYAPLQIGSKRFIARVVVKETRTGQKFYDHDVSNELSPEQLAADAHLPEEGAAAELSGPIVSIKNLLKYVKARHGGTSPMFSLSDSSGISIEKTRAQALITTITSRMANTPEVVVVQNMQDARVPDRMREMYAERNSRGAQHNPEGFFDQGRAYIVLDGISPKAGETDAQALFRVFSHEVLGHAGLRGYFGDRLQGVLREVALKRREDVAKKAREYGLDMRKMPDRLAAAEEVLAEIAQTNPRDSMVLRAIEVIRRLLRGMYLRMPSEIKRLVGGVEFIKGLNRLTDAEIIERFIIPARRHIEQGPVRESEQVLVDRPAWSMGEADGSQAQSSGSDMPRIANRASEVLKLRGFFDSAVDVLRHRAKGLGDLGDRVERFYNGWRTKQGEAYGMLFDPLRTIERLPADQRDHVYRMFARYNAAMENGRQETAQTIYDTQGEHLRALIDAWRRVAAHTGKANQKAGVEVFDPKLGKYRPIGNIDQFWPRMLNQGAKDVLDNPYRNADTTVRWNQMVDELIADGHIEKAEDAAQYISEYFARTQQDHFAGIEKARTMPLPESYYEYGIEGAIRYIENWAQHLSRIEQFGQKKGLQGKDAFDQAIESTTDKATQEYINAVRERAYLYSENTMLTRTVQRANMVATAIHLGNPATASLNLIGGSALNIMAYGWAPTFRGAFDITMSMLMQNPRRAWNTLTGREMAESMFSDASTLKKGHILARQAWKSFKDLVTLPEGLHREMVELGVLRNDFLAIHTDAMQHGLTRNGDRLLSKAVSVSLKAGGYTPFEYFIRTNAAIAGKYQLQKALTHWNKNLRSAKSLAALAWFQRNGFDTDKLIAEGGVGPESRRYMLYASNLTQGSYQIDQTPVWIDTLMGKTFGKYQKFLTQVNRLFYLNYWKPMQKALKGGESVTYTLPDGTKVVDRAGRIKPFMDTLNFFTVPILAYAFLLEPLREKLFGYQVPSPGWDELAKALEDDDTWLAFMLLTQKAWYGILGIGALGLFGNYGQMIYDVADRQRMKNPLDPPALAPVKGMGELIMRLFEQNTLTARDFDDVATQVFSQYRTGKRVSLTAMDALNVEMREVQLEAFRRDRAYVRKLTRRYAEEMGIEAKRRAPTRIGKTEMSPINRRILEELALGNPQTARMMARDYLRTIEDWREREGAWSSMRTAVRGHDPARVAIAPSEYERSRFLKWVEGRVSEENLERVKRTTRDYREAAQAAGFMREDFGLGALREDVRRSVREELYKGASGKNYHIHRLMGVQP